MDVSVVIAIMIALVMVISYVVAAKKERGRDPRWAEEVYLYTGEEPPKDAAAKFGAAVATWDQLWDYHVAGGETLLAGVVADVPGYFTDSGDIVPYEIDQDKSRGVWLYGPKPRRKTPGVQPFRPGEWFQQQANPALRAGQQA